MLPSYPILVSHPSPPKISYQRKLPFDLPTSYVYTYKLITLSILYSMLLSKLNCERQADRRKAR